MNQDALGLANENHLPAYYIKIRAGIAKKLGRVRLRSHATCNKPDNPAVLLQLLDRGKLTGEGWVFQRLSDFNTFPSDRIKVQLLNASGST